jgi:hypothetical protein
MLSHNTIISYGMRMKKNNNVLIENGPDVVFIFIRFTFKSDMDLGPKISRYIA